MSRIDAIIFDCDGVIFDSHSANLAYYNKILTHFSYPPVLPEERQKPVCATRQLQQMFFGN